MRFAQGGGLTPERQGFREKLRLEAAERFAAGQDSALIVKELRVHVRSVQRWRWTWSAGGGAGLASKGPVSRPILSEELFAVLEQELDKGPVAHGWSDQTWTLARIATPIGRRFHKSSTPQGVAALLHRHGWSHQVPARRALERDDAATAAWVKQSRPAAEEPGRRSGPGWSSKTKPGSR
jgi:transposase